MRESPGEFNERPAEDGSGPSPSYPADDLARFRFHTGAPLRPLSSDEPCPVLFRDLGPVALARFLRGELRRIAGPYSPITYMRTAAYNEPYTDFERIGRLVLLRPLALHPWHSGVATIYVARASRMAAPSALGFVPGTVPLDEASRRLEGVRNRLELREALGGVGHDEAVAETLSRLDALARELDRTEVLARPLRRALQSADRGSREGAALAMERVGLTEADLCAAWHHLSLERRGFVGEALRQLGPIAGTDRPRGGFR